MSGAIDNQGMFGGKVELMCAFPVQAQRTAQGDQSIANQPLCQQGAFGGCGACDGKAGYAAWKRERLADVVPAMAKQATPLGSGSGWRGSRPMVRSLLLREA